MIDALLPQVLGGAAQLRLAARGTLIFTYHSISVPPNGARDLSFGLPLVFCGVNVPLESLPEWMSSVSPWLPLTRGIAAARALADGATLSSVSGLLAPEAGIGALYVLIGMVMLSFFEWASRRRATLEVF